jgi:ferritin-like metal-binding protein YciE
MSALHDTLIAELSAIYQGETHLLKNMPKLVEAATNPDLKEALETHRAETEDQVKRLEELFSELSVSPKRKKCKSMEALVEEANDAASEGGDPAILAAAQKVEHYEIASYQALIAWARAMEEEDVLGVLEEILEEEELTNDKLAEIADTSVIPDAVNADEGEEDEEEQETT